MVDRPHSPETAREVAGRPLRWAVRTWRRMGRGWRAVVLGLAIVLLHLLVQTA